MKIESTFTCETYREYRLTGATLTGGDQRFWEVVVYTANSTVLAQNRGDVTIGSYTLGGFGVAKDEYRARPVTPFEREYLASLGVDLTV